jgi:hypothetical protein
MLNTSIRSFREPTPYIICAIFHMMQSHTETKVISALRTLLRNHEAERTHASFHNRLNSHVLR